MAIAEISESLSPATNAQAADFLQQIAIFAQAFRVKKSAYDSMCAVYRDDLSDLPGLPMIHAIKNIRRRWTHPGCLPTPAEIRQEVSDLTGNARFKMMRLKTALQCASQEKVMYETREQRDARHAAKYGQQNGNASDTVPHVDGFSTVGDILAKIGDKK